MSISPAHSSAARLNGALSHGPATDQGKSTSSQNAAKHGIFSTRILSTEDQQSFDLLEQAFFQEHQPATLTESHCVRELANAEWRLSRIRSYIHEIHQAAIPTTDAPTPDAQAAFAYLNLHDTSRSFALFHRYETQFRRQFDKALDQLLKLRQHRPAEQPQPQPQPQAAIPNEPTPPLPPAEQPKLQNEPKPLPQIPRGAPCPCKSGEKFKRCCGKNAPPVLSHRAA